VPIVVPPPGEGYPPRWAVFDRHVGVSQRYFGFDRPRGDVNRFAARYRVAKCFRSVTFDGLAANTVDGYGALCHQLLTYAAFESFLRIVDIDIKKSVSFLSDAECTQVLGRLRGFVGQAEFWAVVKRHVEPRFQRQIDAHLAAAPANPFLLAAAIRHSFAHGHLTATPSGVPPDTAAVITRYSVRVLFRVMDREFERRMLEFEGMLAGR
jgi:hypothetical protein